MCCCTYVLLEFVCVVGYVPFVSHALLICDCLSCAFLKVCVDGVVCCVSAILVLCFVGCTCCSSDILLK